MRSWLFLWQKKLLSCAGAISKCRVLALNGAEFRDEGQNQKFVSKNLCECFSKYQFFNIFKTEISFDGLYFPLLNF